MTRKRIHFQFRATISARAMTTTVNDREPMESQSFKGAGVIKFNFQRGTSIPMAAPQVPSISHTIARVLAPGSSRPLIVGFNASNLPIRQAGLGSKTLPSTGFTTLA
jgi:hypothetical protein